MKLCFIVIFTISFIFLILCFILVSWRTTFYRCQWRGKSKQDDIRWKYDRLPNWNWKTISQVYVHIHPSLFLSITNISSKLALFFLFYLIFFNRFFFFYPIQYWASKKDVFSEDQPCVVLSSLLQRCSSWITQWELQST